MNRPTAASSDLVVFEGYMEYERTGSESADDETPGGVIALDDTGSTRWEAEVGGTQMPVTIAYGTVVASPDKSGLGRAKLQGGGTHPLVALDAASGSLDWRFETRNTFYSTPAVTDDREYVSFREKLWAIDLSDGEPALIEPIGRHVDRQSPIVVGETVLIGDRDFRNRGVT